MEYQIRPVTVDDRAGIVDVFNYYVENTYAAYPEQKVPPVFFDMMMEMAKGYPFYVAEQRADAESGSSALKKVIGYGLLRPHMRMDTFRRSAELTCFIAPEYTGKGIGRSILDRLVPDAGAMGIDTILASVSSQNEGSINFHKKYGFTECGTFRKVGKKFGNDLDEVWLQLFI